MITVNGKNYQNFEDWKTQEGENTLKGISFNDAKDITTILCDTKRDDVVNSAFSHYGIVFRTSKKFLVIGNDGRKRLWQFIQVEGGEILRLESTTDYHDFIVARCNEKAIVIPENDLPDKHRANNNKCGKSRKINLRHATIENIGTLKAQLNSILKQVDALADVADVSGLIDQLECKVRSAWAYQLQAQRKQAQRNAAMQKLQGLTPEQLEKVMALLK